MALLGLIHACSTSKPPVTSPEPTEPKVLILNKTNDEVIDQAVNLANECLGNSEFLNSISEYAFTYTDKTSEEVEDTFKSANKPSEVVFYKTWNPWSSAVAERSGKYIRINSWRHPRPLKSVFETMMHEYAHIIGFGHPFNSTPTRPDSVPYKVQVIAVEKCLKL